VAVVDRFDCTFKVSMSNLFGTLSKMRKTNKKTANGSLQFNGMKLFFFSK
jgi:hypothetical protein